MRLPIFVLSALTIGSSLLAAGCDSQEAEPGVGVKVAALSAGCGCTTGTWTHVDVGSASPYVLGPGQSLCIDEGTYSGNVQTSAGSVICVDTDAAMAVAQVNLAGRLVVFGAAGSPEAPVSVTFVEGAGLDNFGVTELGSVNFNGAANIVNYRGAELNFRSSFALRNGSNLSNGGILRAISNFDTAVGTVFLNEGYAYISGELAFEGESDNHGLLEITTRVNVNPTASFRNYCTLISLGAYNVNGTYLNDGLALVYGSSGALEFNVTSAGTLQQGPLGSVIVTTMDGPGGTAIANMRVDGQIRGEGLIYVDDATICQGSGSVIGLPELTFHDATPTGSHPIFDTMTGTVLNVVRGETPTLPTLAEARLGRIGSDCRTGVACEDTAPPGGVDTGCDEGLPACIGIEDTSICVECEVDLDCRGGFVCNVGVRRCQPGPGPAAVDDVLRVAEGGSVSVPLVSLALNDLNVTPATVTLGTPSHGTATVVEGVLTYEPGSDPPAQAVIPYAICGIGPNAEVCVEARVVVMINRAPDLVGAMIVEAVGVPSTSLDLAVRYLDPEGHPLDMSSLMVVSVVTTTGELTGTAVVVDGVLVFTPTDPAVPGVVEVRVVGCDLGVPAACGESVVTFVRNDPPVLGDVTVTVDRGGVATVPLSAVLVGTGVVHGDDPGDGDVDGIGVVSVVSGLCEWDGTSFVVTAPEVIGEASCVVSVCEEVPLVGVCSESALTVVVVGRVPVVQDDVATVVEDGSVVVDVLDNDEDPDGDLLEVRDITTAPEHGTAVVVDGQVVYTPADGYVGEDSFVYEACDADGMCDSAVVTVTVVPGGPDNRQPIAGDDVATLDEDGEVTIEVLENDVDPDGDSLEIRDIVNEPGHGTATIVDGAVIYVPDADYNGEDSFTYQVCDAGGLCDTATVTVTVVAVEDEPEVVEPMPDEGPEVVEPLAEVGPEVSEPLDEIGPEVVEPVAEVGPEAGPDESPETVESNPEDDNAGLEGLTAEGGGGCAGSGGGSWWVGLVGVAGLLRRRVRHG